jgi:Ca2+-binding RTX toxin-like protein
MALCVASALIALLCLAAPARAAGPRCFGKKPTIVGTSGSEVIRGTPRADVIVGRAGFDRIRGRGGNDLICGGDIAGDLLFGGKGSDRLDGGTGKETIYGGPGNDEIRVRCGDCFNTVSTGQFSYGGPGNDKIYGSPEEDEIHGGDGHDFIDGKGSRLGLQAGPDQLSGGAGDDDIIGGEPTPYDDIAGSNVDGGDGDDRMRVLDNMATLVGGQGNDTYIGAEVCCTRVSFVLSANPVVVDLVNDSATGEGDDVLQDIHHIDGTEFADTIIGDHLENRLRGFGGTDLISGGSGIDVLEGGDGTDTLDFPTEVSVEVDLEAGFSRSLSSGEQDRVAFFENVIGTPGADVITGDAARNVIWGGAGADRIFGAGGADQMFGEVGDDTLDGSDDGPTVQIDLANGGTGFDVCTRAEEKVDCEA